MVGEVNKIIYNMLISGKGVFLPEVGTLYIERQGARKISDNKLISPRNVVSFTSQEQAPSLVDEIVSIAGCSQEQAEDIYNRWLLKTREGNTVTIGGVGVLNHKSFAIESAFGAAINPKGVKTIVIRSKSNTWLYVLCALCVAVALGFFAYIMWGDRLFGPAKFETKTVVEEVDTAQANDAAQGDAVQADGALASVEVQNQESQQNQSAVSAQQGGVSGATNGEYYAYYVVMGVFSSEQNAERAVAQAKEKLSGAACAILPFKGDKFMVTLYGSDSLEECNEFARNNRDVFGDLWVYNKR